MFHLVVPGTVLRAGAFGIPEPAPDAPEVAIADLALLIVPGVAFDPVGRRLGFGGGYYDGVIDEARAAGAVAIGLAYDFQIVDDCPAGPADVGVDAIVTDAQRLSRNAMRSCLSAADSAVPNSCPALPLPGRRVSSTKPAAPSGNVSGRRAAGSSNADSVGTEPLCR